MLYPIVNVFVLTLVKSIVVFVYVFRTYFRLGAFVPRPSLIIKALNSGRHLFKKSLSSLDERTKEPL